MCVPVTVCHKMLVKNVTEGNRAKRGTRTDGREALRCSSIIKYLEENVKFVRYNRNSLCNDE